MPLLSGEELRRSDEEVNGYGSNPKQVQGSLRTAQACLKIWAMLGDCAREGRGTWSSASSDPEVATNRSQVLRKRSAGRSHEPGRRSSAAGWEV